jgi:multiple sugar transport system ATP-binding protein
MAKVTIDNVHKSYGEGAKRVDILKGVSCDLADGELLVLVGPSGCGKSTLLRMVAGLEDISAGTLSIGGRVVNDVKPADRDIAMVFQSYALYPHLTVQENIAFGLRLRKTPKDEEQRLVREAAGILGLDELLHRYPKELSGGQRQRVAMGRAIVRKPAVFLFDEPLSNLDAALRGRMRVEIKKLHRRLGVTMIYVTHDQVEAMTLADRIVVLKDGVVQQVGTPRELYDRPANRFVGGFIGTPEMNVFPGTLARDGGALSFAVKGGGRVALGPDVLSSPATEGAEALLGLRPADLTVAEGPSALTGVLEVIEPLGWESLLHLGVAGQPLVVQTETERARRLQVGAEVPVAVDPARCHVFDARTGVRL